jgi:alpha-galactosidase
MKWKVSVIVLLLLADSIVVWPRSGLCEKIARSGVDIIRGGALSVETFSNGSYALHSTAVSGEVLRSEVEADIAGSTLKSSLYPQHLTSIASFHDELGAGRMLTVTHTGLRGIPDLVCDFRLYDDLPWGDIQVRVYNSTSIPVDVQAIHVVRNSFGTVMRLNGPDAEDRILSDSFSEDTPQLKLMDLGEPTDGMHRAFGSQLVYNRQSGESLFMGALSADKFLTVFHLKSSGKGPGAHVLSYDVAATGTNEALSEETERGYSSANNVLLRLSVPSGGSISSERLMFAIGPHYHEQLENYGRVIRILHKALVTIPTPIGWWSWTAYYYGVTQGPALTNAAWLAQNLESLGYRYFQIDEGYQYARGEYATPDRKAFPLGMAYVGDQVRKLGLTFGVWVAPFQVSERSWVYEHHKDWLVHSREGEPIHIGKVGGKFEELYALDTTNPGAENYLRYTYSTLVNDWGIRFIKMDFMDSSAVEGVFYRPNTTALEALRIGLETIRNTVGNDVVLDKDGSPMLTPVGIVNTGRISQDTGHTFESTRDAASGVAARYYMNRDFFVTDPDAFTVSMQTIPDRAWHGNVRPLTLNEAEVSIALSAVSGGMFEIGDDLPTLGASPERLALVRNPDLLDMARLGHAAVPIDLMTYLPADMQPSIFLLKEDRRQQIVAIFNWTEEFRSHTLALNSFGLNENGSYTATDALRGGSVTIQNDTLAITQPPHSVRILKLVDTTAESAKPAFETYALATALAGTSLELRASSSSAETPVLQYHWAFGDGVSAEGSLVSHAYTHAGQYTVTITAIGLNGVTLQHTLGIVVTGTVPTIYDPSAKERYEVPK